MKKGKKLLAVVSALAILTVCMVSSLAMPLVGSAGEVATPKVFVDFSTQAYQTNANYSVGPYGSNTNLAYSSTEQALELTIKETSTKVALAFSVNFASGGTMRANIDAQPVMAYLVKVEGSTTTKYQIGGHGKSSAVIGPKHGGVANFDNNKNADGYQLIVWDTSAQAEDPFPAADTVWFETRAFLKDTSVAPVAGDKAYVKWAGAFASVKDAYAYAGLTMPADTNFKSNAYVDYSTSAITGVDGYVSDSGLNTVYTRTYDETEQAMRLHAVDGITMDGNTYRLLPKLTTPYQTVQGKYAYVGVMVKLEDASYANYTPSVKGVFTGTAAGNDKTLPASEIVKGYDATTDWQLIIARFNVNHAYMTDGASTKAQWKYLFMYFTGDSTAPAAAKSVWIKWAGVFKSEDDIYAHAGMQKPGSGGSEGDGEGGGSTPELPTSSVANYSAGSNYAAIGIENHVSESVWAGFSDRGYDATEGAYKIVPKNIGTPAAPVYSQQVYELFPKFLYKQNVDGHMFAAAYVKLGDVSLASYTPVFNGHTKNGVSDRSAGRLLKGYKATTDWQLIVFEFDHTASAFQDNGGDAVWDMLDMRLNGNVIPTQAHPIWVKWAGIFESEAAAYTHAGLTPPPSEDGPVAPNTPAILVDTSMATPYGGTLAPNDPTRTDIAYDAAEQAWLVKPTETAPFKGAQVVTSFNNQKREYESYKTIAAWVKLNKPDTSGGRAVIGTKNDRWTANVYYDAATPETTYTYSTEYQLVIWNAEDVQGETVTPADPNVPVLWTGVILQMLQEGTTPTQNDKFWIKWVGVFASEDDAYGYAGVEKPESNVNTSGVTPATMLDFSKNVAGGATPIDNTKIEYDTTQMALKVSPIDGNMPKACSVQLRYNPRVPVDGTDNKVYAALVKTADIDAVAGSFVGGTENDQALTATFSVGGSFEYSGTTDWQLVVYDDRKSSSLGYVSQEGLTANLFVVQLRLLDYNLAPENDLPIWIKWTGVFTSVEEAYKYAGMEIPTPDPNAKQPPSPFFYDYSKKMAAGSVRTDGEQHNTLYKYDKQEKALKVYPIDYKKGVGGRIVFNCKAETSVKDYPVFAMYVKIPDKSLRFKQFSAGTDSNGKYSSTFLSSLKSKGYAQTTEYQLVIFDGTNYDEINDAFTGKWKGALLDLVLGGPIFEEGQAIYIKWAGAFSSLQAVYDYTGEVYVEEYIEPNKNGPSDFFWELDNWNVVKFHVGEETDTDAAYNIREGAMSVTAIDFDNDGVLAESAGTITLGLKSRIKKELNAKDYPYVAMRIKLGRPDMVGSWAKYRTTYTVSEYQNDNLEAADMDFAMLEYTPSTEWQTIVIDCASGFAGYSFDGKWIGLTLSLFDSLYTVEEDVMYIKWAGAFKSIDDVKAYMKKTEGTEEFAPAETPEEPSDEEGDGSYEGDEEYDDEHGDEQLEEDTDVDEPDDTTSDSDSSTKKTSRKKVYRTKKVLKNQEESTFPLLYVGIGIAVLAIAGLVVFFIVRKKRTPQEKAE